MEGDMQFLLNKQTFSSSGEHNISQLRRRLSDSDSHRPRSHSLPGLQNFFQFFQPNIKTPVSTTINNNNNQNNNNNNNNNNDSTNELETKK